MTKPAKALSCNFSKKVRTLSFFSKALLLLLASSFAMQEGRTKEPSTKQTTSTQSTSVLGSFASSLGFGGQATQAPSFAPLVEKLLPAVVNISTQQTVVRRFPDMPQFPPGSPFEHFFQEFFDGYRPMEKPRKITSLGSGFIIDSSGYIVTNYHVIAEAEEITVILQDGSELKATIVGRDGRTDLALLKVEASRPLPHVKWGDSSKARVGDHILAIGNPFGLGGTVTAGIVSSISRDISKTRLGGGSGYLDDFIQIDASINFGNSGGPLFNLEGEVIGINTAILSPNGANIGIGFSIPSAVAQPVINQLRQYGKAKRGWVGVSIQELNREIADQFGLDKAQGALVTGITREGPAAKAGVKVGDVILSFDNKPILNARKLSRLVGDTPVDQKVEVKIWRNKKPLKLEITVGQQEDTEKETPSSKFSSSKNKNAKSSVLGLVLAPLSSEVRAQLELKADIQGVLITDVDSNSPAAEKGIRDYDIIIEVSQTPVHTPEEVIAKVEEAKNRGERNILLQLYRDGEISFEVLSLQYYGQEKNYSFLSHSQPGSPVPSGMHQEEGDRSLSVPSSLSLEWFDSKEESLLPSLLESSEKPLSLLPASD